jgi:hypothetical protein
MATVDGVSRESQEVACAGGGGGEVGAGKI